MSEDDGHSSPETGGGESDDAGPEGVSSLVSPETVMAYTKYVYESEDWHY